MILNVQDIIKEITKETSYIFDVRVFLPPPSPVLANINFSILAYGVPGTDDVGLPTKLRFNAGPALQPIAGSNTGSVVYFAQTRGIQPVLFQCWPTVFDAGPSLKQHWVIVSCFLTAALCWWRFNIPAPETPGNTIHWPNVDVMLGHRLQRMVNIIPTKSF